MQYISVQQSHQFLLGRWRESGRSSDSQISQRRDKTKLDILPLDIEKSGIEIKRVGKSCYVIGALNFKV